VAADARFRGHAGVVALWPAGALEAGPDGTLPLERTQRAMWNRALARGLG
jgi:hypothetical protein